MCACSLIQCQPALHSCTLLQWGVHTHALLVQLPMQIFYLPTFCSPHSLRDTCPGSCQRRAIWGVCWLADFNARRGSFQHGYDLGQGQATSSGPQLYCVASIDFGEPGVALWVRELGMGDGECCGSGGSVHMHLGTYTCPLRGRISRTQWCSLLWSEEVAAQLQKPSGPAGWNGCLAFCPHPGEMMSCPSEWSSRHSPGDSMAGTEWTQCPGGGLWLIVAIIYFCLFISW